MYLKLHFASLLFWAAVTFAKTIGPRGTITLSNKDISPDGFKRSYVPTLFLSAIVHWLHIRASVINDGHPGPVITANKARFYQYLKRSGIDLQGTYWLRETISKLMLSTSWLIQPRFWAQALYVYHCSLTLTENMDFKLALARHVPKEDQLHGWCYWCYPVPNCTG